MRDICGDIEWEIFFGRVEEGEGGTDRAEVKEGFVCRLKFSFVTLSEKYVANSCGRAARGNDVGRERLAVLCRILLIVFQRVRGSDEEDWTSEA